MAVGELEGSDNPHAQALAAALKLDLQACGRRGLKHVVSPAAHSFQGVEGRWRTEVRKTVAYNLTVKRHDWGLSSYVPRPTILHT